MSPTRRAGSSILAKSSSFSASENVDKPDEGIDILGEDRGLGKILLGLRYHSSTSCLEVHVFKANGLCCRTLSPSAAASGSRASAAVASGPKGDPTKPSTYCTLSFMPDATEPVSTVVVESNDCPRWRGVFRFERFPWNEASINQRGLLVQVCQVTTETIMGEATLLLGNWNRQEYEKGVRVWKYLTNPLESQQVSEKSGNLFMTLCVKGEKLKMTIHRIADLNTRWTSPTERPEFYAKLQAVVSGRVVKEATLKGLRSSSNGEVNFFDGRFNVRLGKQGLTLRLVLSRQVGCIPSRIEQDVLWLHLGADVKRFDCRTLYQSVLETPNQTHMLSVRMNKPPVPSNGYLPTIKT